jgi:hypothetical protein
MSHYSSAAQARTGQASVRFRAASSWAHVAQVVQHPSLLQAYTVALDLLPQLAWLGLSITDRHYLIQEAGPVVQDATAAAIAASHYTQAIEWLEQGRSIIWGQLLQLRTPIEDLKMSHPNLANRLIFLSTQLELFGIRESSPEKSDTQIRKSPLFIAKQCHDYAYERDELIKKIRELEGFNRFMLPKTFSELSTVAKAGPVVVLNISNTRCDALILLPGLDDNEVMHVPLPDFMLSDAQTFQESLSHLTGAGRNSSTNSDRLFGQREGQKAPEEELQHILSKLWTGIVIPILNALAITVCNWAKHTQFLSLTYMIDSINKGTPTGLVVSNWPSFISSNSCCRGLWKRSTFWVKAI